MCLRTRIGAKIVGISNRTGVRPVSRLMGVHEMTATCDSDGVAEADSSLMFPAILRPAPGKASVVPHVGKVLQWARM